MVCLRLLLLLPQRIFPGSKDSLPEWAWICKEKTNSESDCVLCSVILVWDASSYLAQQDFEHELYMSSLTQCKARQGKEGIIFHCCTDSWLKAVPLLFVYTHKVKSPHTLLSPPYVNIQTACRFSCLLNPIIWSERITIKGIKKRRLFSKVLFGFFFFKSFVIRAITLSHWHASESIKRQCGVRLDEHGVNLENA